MLRGIWLLWVCIYVSNLSGQTNIKQVDFAFLDADCIRPHEQYEIEFILYAFDKSIPQGDLTLSDHNGVVLFQKTFKEPSSKWYKHKLYLEEVSPSYTLRYVNDQGNTLDQEVWSPRKAAVYSINTTQIKSSQPGYGKIGITGDYHKVNVYNQDKEVDDYESLDPGHYKIVIQSLNGCESTEYVTIHNPKTQRRTKNLTSSTETVLLTSEACENDSLIFIQMYENDLAGSSLLPITAEYQLYQLPDPGDFSTAIEVSHYLVTRGDSVFFNVNGRAGKYRVFYDGAIQDLNAPFDIQELNHQFNTKSGLFCSNDGLIQLSPNPEGGTLTGQGVLDSTTLNAAGRTAYLIDPSQLTLGVSYNYQYAYTQMQGSNLLCSDVLEDSLTIVPPPVVSIDLSATEACFAEEVMITATAAPEDGYNGALFYQWFDPNGALLSNDSILTHDITLEGDYVVRAYINYGAATCAISDSSNIRVKELPELELPGLAYTICPNTRTGIVEVSGIDTSRSYTYMWSTGDTTSVVDSLPAGTYYVTVTDLSTGCAAVDSTLIVDPETIVINCDVGIIPTTCNDSDDGVNQVVATGGISPYEYSIDGMNYDTSSRLVNLPKGNHTVWVRDSLGCIAICEFFVPGPDELVAISEVSQDLLCNGDSSGQVSLSVFGGTMPYRYLWNTGDTTQIISGLTTGLYSVTVTDSQGCIDTLLLELEEPTEVQLRLDLQQEIECYDALTGAIIAHITGGTPPYKLVNAIDDTIGMTSDSLIINNLGSGPIILDAIDANGCMTTAMINLIEPEELRASISPTDILCHGDNSGSLTSTVLGGTPPYRYVWSTGDTTVNIDNQGPGRYMLIVTDINGCVTDANASIAQPDSISIVINVNASISCHSEADGSISAQVMGGTPPYQYNWSTGDTVSSILGLGVGTYDIIVSDAQGCQKTASIMLNDPPLLIVDITNDSLLCPGDQEGILEAFPQGGTPPYSYLWSTGDTTKIIDQLKIGTYSVQVFDSESCFQSTSSFVWEPDTLAISLSADSTVCLGEIAKIYSDVSGGTAPYKYSWSIKQSGSTGAVDSNITFINPACAEFNAICLNEGSLIVELEITDANDCIHYSQVEVLLKSCFDLAIRKTTKATLVNRGDTVLFDIEVFNQGSQIAYDVKVVDLYPEDLIFVEPVIGPDSHDLNDYWNIDLKQTNVVYTIIDSIMPSTKVDLDIAFEILQSTESMQIYNESRVVEYSSITKEQPIDEDDFDEDLLQEGESSVEKDDDIEDDDNGSIDNPFDEDRIDGAIVTLCTYDPVPQELAGCVSSGESVQSLIAGSDPNQTLLGIYASENDAIFSQDPIDLTGDLNTVWIKLSDANSCIGVTNVSIDLTYEPEIVRQPKDTIVCPIYEVTFGIQAEGSNLSYQWEKNDGTGWQAISGATSDTLNLGLFDAEMLLYSYRVIVGTPIGSSEVCENISRPVRVYLDPCQSDLICRGDMISYFESYTCELDLPTPDEILMVASPFPHEVRWYDENDNRIFPPFDKEMINQTIFYKVYNLSTLEHCWGSLQVKADCAENISQDTIFNICKEVSPWSEDDIQNFMSELASNCFMTPESYVVKSNTSGTVCDTIFTEYTLIGKYNECDQEENVIARRINAQLPTRLDDLMCPPENKEVQIDCSQSPHPDSLISYFDDPFTLGINEGIAFSRPYILIKDQYVHTVAIDSEGVLDTVSTSKADIPADAQHQSSGCNYHITYQDIDFPTCISGTGKIYREWTITDWCLKETTTCTQSISLIDTIPPVLDMVDTVITAIESWGCTASINLPEVFISDNCSSNTSLNWSTSSGQVVEGQLIDIHLSDSPVRLTATVFDNCGNADQVFSTIIIKDETIPVPVCIDRGVVVPPTNFVNQNGLLKASSLDIGSNDGGCQEITLTILRKEDFDAGPLRHPGNGEVLIDSEGYVAYHVVNPCYTSGQISGTYMDNGQSKNYSYDYVRFDEYIEFCCGDINGLNVVVKVSDPQGNFNYCYPEIGIKQSDRTILNCEDLQLSCDDDTNPEVVGVPTLIGLCDTIALSNYSDRLYQEGCTDFIERTWSFDEMLCSQLISISGTSTFDPKEIKWPMHHDGDASEGVQISCNDDVIKSTIGHNEKTQCLSPVDSRPQWTESHCQLIASSYEDDFFSIDQECTVIKRKWLIVDWCSFENNVSSQVDDTYKSIYNSCEDESYVSFDNVVVDGYYQYDQVIKLDSKQQIILSNIDSDFRIADNSGQCYLQLNLSFDLNLSCQHISVFDRPFLWDVTIQSPNTDIVFGPYEGSGKNVRISENIPYDTAYILSVNMIDVCGNNVTTKYLLTDYATCDSEVSSSIYGNIINDHNQGVESAIILVDDNPMLASDIEGAFSINNYNIAPRKTTVSVYKNDDWLNGVNVVDLLILQRLVLGLDEFESNSMRIIADINGDWKHSSLDVVWLRKILLGIEEAMPDQQSWMFLDRSKKIIWDSDEINSLRKIILDNSSTNSEFLGLKIGDLNRDATANSKIAKSNVSSSSIPISVELEEGHGNQIRTEISFKEDIQISAMQLVANTDGFHIDEVLFEGVDDQDIYWSHRNNELTILWSNIDSRELGDQDIISVVGSHTHSPEKTLLSFNSQRSGIIDSKEGWKTIYINNEVINRPQLKLSLDGSNPFLTQTKIAISVAESGMAEKSIIDINGRAVYHDMQWYDQGIYDFDITEDMIESRGIYYFRVEFKDQIETIKLVKL